MRINGLRNQSQYKTATIKAFLSFYFLQIPFLYPLIKTDFMEYEQQMSIHQGAITYFYNRDKKT